MRDEAANEGRSAQAACGRHALGHYQWPLIVPFLPPRAFPKSAPWLQRQLLVGLRCRPPFLAARIPRRGHTEGK